MYRASITDRIIQCILALILAPKRRKQKAKNGGGSFLSSFLSCGSLFPPGGGRWINPICLSLLWCWYVGRKPHAWLFQRACKDLERKIPPPALLQKCIFACKTRLSLQRNLQTRGGGGDGASSFNVSLHLERLSWMWDWFSFWLRLYVFFLAFCLYQNSEVTFSTNYVHFDQFLHTLPPLVAYIIGKPTRKNKIDFSEVLSIFY